MTYFEAFAEMVTTLVGDKDEQLYALCKLLHIHPWEAERLLEQAKFNKKMRK